MRDSRQARRIPILVRFGRCIAPPTKRLGAITPSWTRTRVTSENPLVPLKINVKQLSRRLRRPIATLIALAEVNDPFHIPPYRVRDAEWFVRLWSDFKLPMGIHVRRIHYFFTSLDIILPTGGRYVNTLNCSKDLGRAAKDAIFLDLLPAAAIVDNRNPEPREFLVDSSQLARLAVYGGEEEVYARLDSSEEPPSEKTPSFYSAEAIVPELSLPDIRWRMPSLPWAQLTSRPEVAQRYHLETWIEKSTADDITERLVVRIHHLAESAIKIRCRLGNPAGQRRIVVPPYLGRQDLGQPPGVEGFECVELGLTLAKAFLKTGRALV